MEQPAFPPDLNLLELVQAGGYFQPDVINQWVVNLKFEPAFEARLDSARLVASMEVELKDYLWEVAEEVHPRDYQEGMWKYLVEEVGVVELVVLGPEASLKKDLQNSSLARLE